MDNSNLIYRDFGNGIVELDPEFAGALVDVFEDFLESKGIQIENPEKEGDEGEAILFGSDYDEIVQGLTDVMKSWVKITKRTCRSSRVS